MFPSCLDLTISFNILFFILQLFTNPVRNFRFQIYIRIFRSSVEHFSAQHFPVPAFKKVFRSVYFFTVTSRSKMQILTYCFIVNIESIHISGIT